MFQTACLSHEQLRDFSLGRVSAVEDERIAEHLDQCESCQQAAAECDRSADSLVAALRLPDDGLSDDDVHCDAALVRAKQLAAGSVDGRHERTEPIRLREYELLRKLGEGGMGTVYLARHTRLDRIVALKILPPDRMRDSSAVARFEREMRAVGGLDHPAIVRATDAGDVDGTHFLVMEYVEGLDLSSLVERLGPIGIADACELVRQAALGLQHVHERGMVHRDIKPSNLMLTPRGEVKILDLGLALLQRPDGELQGITTVGRFMGTLDYMAPEQADDSHEVDIRADVYGLGATLYRLICGVPPFAGKEYRSPLKKLKALATEPVPPVRERRPEAPAGLAQVIERMLAKEPEARYGTPVEVAEALAPFAAGSSLAELQRTAESNQLAPQVDPVGQGSNLPEPSGRMRRRSRSRFLVILLALAALVAAAAIYVETDKGTLVIQSPDPGIEVLIRRGGKPADDWELQRGENRTTVRSGRYEIVLIGASDGLRVKDGTFTLTRGGEHVATIERVEAEREADSAEEPWFGGMGGGSAPGLGGAMPGVIPIPVPATGKSGFGGESSSRIGGGSMAVPPIPGPGQPPATEPPGGKADSSDKEALQGTWDVKQAKDDGRHTPLAETRAMKLVFAEDYFEFQDGSRVLWRGTYQIDASAEPKTITFFEYDKEKPLRGIYRLEGGKLKIVYNEYAGGERPSAFVSEPDSPNDVLMELHRTDEPLPATRTGEEPGRTQKNGPTIQGAWNVVSSEYRGEPVDAQEVAERSFFFAEEHFLIRDGKQVEEAGTYSLQPDGDRIVLVAERRDGEGKRQHIYGRYELKGDELRLAVSNEDFPPLPLVPTDAEITVWMLRRAENGDGMQRTDPTRYRTPGGAQPAAPDAASDRQAIQGIWRAVSDGSEKEAQPGKAPDRAVVLTFTEERFVLRTGDKVELAGTYELEPGTSPKRLRLHVTEEFGRAEDFEVFGIYALNGDELQLALDDDRQPTDFAPKQNDFAFVLRRAAGAAGEEGNAALLQLEQLVGLAEQRLERAKQAHATRAISSVDLDAAHAELTEAQIKLVEATGTKQQVLDLLKKRVSQAEKRLEFIERLHKRGYASASEAADAKESLIHAQIRLASAQQSQG